MRSSRWFAVCFGTQVEGFADQSGWTNQNPAAMDEQNFLIQSILRACGTQLTAILPETEMKCYGGYTQPVLIIYGTQPSLSMLKYALSTNSFLQ